MLSTVSDHLSALKKKHHDDLPDYRRGFLAGIISTHLAIVTVNLGYILLGHYQRRR